MSDHTPGPWAISGDYGLLSSEIIAPNDYRHAIASVWTKRSTEKGTVLVWREGEANACLIAEAPALLEACEAALRCITGLVMLADKYGVLADDDIRVRETLGAAIAKARGEEP